MTTHLLWNFPVETVDGETYTWTDGLAQPLEVGACLHPVNSREAYRVEAIGPANLPNYSKTLQRVVVSRVEKDAPRIATLPDSVRPLKEWEPWPEVGTAEMRMDFDTAGAVAVAVQQESHVLLAVSTTITERLPDGSVKTTTRAWRAGDRT